MLRFYSYRMMKIPETPSKCDGLKYVIIENENDEKECLKILGEYVDEYEQDISKRTAYIEDLMNCISRRHTLIDYAVEHNVLKEKSELLYPNVWMYNNIAGAWVLMNEIISDATKLNTKLKSKSKTENQIRNSNSDFEIEIQI